MSCLQTVVQSAPPFDYPKWSAQLPELAKQYTENRPLPHIFLPGLLDEKVALSVSDEFPAADSNAWIQYKHHNENKLGLSKRALFSSGLGQVADELNSPEFVHWLSQLTGIPNLMSDPSLEGGGLHQSGRGGFLNLHTDFSHHHYQKNWRRRVNLILYLNREWQPEWGGSIEIWDSAMKECNVKYPPLLNHAMIFNTDERCFHGFPEPLACPEGTTRKSLAFYYYTLDTNLKVTPRSTDYRARPQDGIAQSALIWLDKQAVSLYSRAKERFGFSDDLASRVLGLISRKK